MAIHSHHIPPKRDTAEIANGFLIYNGSAGYVVPASGGKITPQCLSDIENTLGNHMSLYGHAITRGGKTKGHDSPAATPVVWFPNLGTEQTDEIFSVDCFGELVAAVGVRC